MQSSGAHGWGVSHAKEMPTILGEKSSITQNY